MENKENKYFDLQVNGYAGVDFNNENLSFEELKYSCEKLIADNVEGILATIITDNLDKMKRKIANISKLMEKDSVIRKVIRGLHIEGPFLNKTEGYRGAHPKEFIHNANIKEMYEILAAGNGAIKLVTLAPETDESFSVIKMLRKENIVVSAGHSNASLEILKGAIDSGLSMFTHLGNGCPKTIERHNNIIERVLSFSKEISICFIADGYHIPFFALSNYLNSVGYKKAIIVTDAMAAASAPPGKYRIGDIKVNVEKDGIVRQPGRNNLAGSSVTMKKTAINLAEKLKLTQEQIENLTNKNPKTALGIV